MCRSLYAAHPDLKDKKMMKEIVVNLGTICGYFGLLLFIAMVMSAILKKPEWEVWRKKITNVWVVVYFAVIIAEKILPFG